MAVHSWTLATLAVRGEGSMVVDMREQRWDHKGEKGLGARAPNGFKEISQGLPDEGKEITSCRRERY